MNLKAGIMTWYTYNNYGTVLQASALYYILKRFECEPFMIKYKPWGRIKKNQNIILIFVLKVISKFKYLSKGNYNSNQKKKLFNDFKNDRLQETPRCNELSELQSLNSELDVFLCGSDQIWSPFRYDDNFFLSFVKDPKKMIAYAPSFGQTEVKNVDVREEMKQQLVRFEYLSAREKQGAELIHKICEKEATVVLDPTLLLNAQEWDDYAEVNNVNKIKGSYMICYFLGDARKYEKYVKKLANLYDIPVYVIPITKQMKKSKCAVPFEVGPSEFVSLIKNAQHVCTDSFHGIAFSINYNIPFTAFKRFSDDEVDSQNSRIIDILTNFGLLECLVNPTTSPEIDKLFEYNYSKINTVLLKERDGSLNYLKTALENISKYKIADNFVGGKSEKH